MYPSIGAATLIQLELIGLISLGQQEVEHRVLQNNYQLHIDPLLPQGLLLYQPVCRYVFGYEILITDLKTHLSVLFLDVFEIFVEFHKDE